MFELWVKLHAIDGLGLVSDTGVLRVFRARNNDKTSRKLDELVKVAHVCCAGDAGKRFCVVGRSG